MVNVKLGNKTYEGVTAVKLDTTDGGSAMFSPGDSSSGNTVAPYECTLTFTNGVCDLTSTEAGQGFIEWVKSLNYRVSEDFGGFSVAEIVVAVNWVADLRVQTGTNQYRNVWWGGSSVTSLASAITGEMDGTVLHTIMPFEIQRVMGDLSQMLYMIFEHDMVTNALTMTCKYGYYASGTWTVFEFKAEELNTDVEIVFMSVQS